MKIAHFAEGEYLGSMMGYAKETPFDGWAVVGDNPEEYANGGRGPCQAIKGFWSTELEARAALARAEKGA